jgi:hypothetical protein
MAIAMVRLEKGNVLWDSYRDVAPQMLKLFTARKLEAVKERRLSTYFFVVDFAIAILIL